MTGNTINCTKHIFFLKLSKHTHLYQIGIAGESQKYYKTLSTGTNNEWFLWSYSFTNFLGSVEELKTGFGCQIWNTKKITNQWSFCAICQFAIMVAYCLQEDTNVVGMAKYIDNLVLDRL